MPRLAGGCSLLAAVAASLGLLGWILGSRELETLGSQFASMKPLTAVALLLLAAAAVVPRQVAIGTVLAVLVIALLVLAEYVLDSNLGVDQLLFHDGVASAHPGRPSMASALSLAVLAVGWLLNFARRRVLAQVAGALVLLVSTLALLGFVYDVPSVYAIQPFSTVAVHTAAALALLAVALLASVEQGALSWAVLGHDQGASLLRRLLPVALIVLPVLGYLSLQLQRDGYYDATVTVAFIVVICGVAMVLLTWLAANRLARVDRRRAHAHAELVELKEDLEIQVEDRAQLLQRRQNEIAVLEDRQRIAADLHDIVIQRLFAAGMFLQGASVVVTDPEARSRVDTAVEAMDGAIRDLRSSIFELGQRAILPVDLPVAVAALCSESTRMLGFEPSVFVGDLEGQADDARDDILAVLREALANIARHAGAESVSVRLELDAGTLSLTVADDGCGVAETPHSSGTRNMSNRARRRGGDCTWATVEPHGTRMHWWVPTH